MITIIVSYILFQRKAISPLKPVFFPDSLGKGATEQKGDGLF
jgi:hypothetical protein